MNNQDVFLFFIQQRYTLKSDYDLGQQPVLTVGGTYFDDVDFMTYEGCSKTDFND